MARLTHAVFSLVRPARFSGAVSVSVSKRLIVLVLAASRSPSRHGPHGWVLGQAVGIVGVLVARQPAIHRLPEQRYQMMLHVPARSAVLEGVSSQAGHAQGVVKFADGQEAGVGGDGGTTELQAHSAIEMHSELSVGIFTHGASNGVTASGRTTYLTMGILSDTGQIIDS